MTKTKNSGKLKFSVAIVLAMLMSVFMPLVQVFAANLDRQSTLHIATVDGYEVEMPYLWMDGEVAFCVDMRMFAQPGEGYVGSEDVSANAHDLALISYYGWYLHRNDSNANWYRMVTQLMIWEHIHGAATNFVDASASTDPSEWVSVMGAYQTTKTEILSQVQDYNRNPSFHGQTVTINNGQSVTLTDTNNVLHQLSVLRNSADVAVELNSNKVTFTAKDSSKNNGTVIFTKIEPGYIGVPMYYQKAGSQDVVITRLKDPANGVVTFNILKNGELEFTKQNPNGTPITANARYQVQLNGVPVKFTSTAAGSYAADPAGTVMEVQLNAGKFVVTNLEPGNYTIHELVAPTGTYNAEPVPATIEAGQRTQVTMTNQLQTGTLTLTKTGQVFNGWSVKTQVVTAEGVDTIEDKEVPDSGKTLSLYRIEQTEQVTEPSSTEKTTPTTVIAETPTPTTAPTTTVAPTTTAPSTTAAPATAATASVAVTETTTAATTEATTASTTTASTTTATTEATTAATEAPATEATIAPLATEATTEGGMAGGGSIAPPTYRKFVGSYVTDATGSVNITGLADGHYVLVDDRGTVLVDKVVADNGSIAHTLPLVKKQDVKPATNSEKTLSVNVPSWSTGNIGGVSFELRAAKNLYALDGKTLLFASGAVVKSGTTDANGALSFTGIPFGDYSLVETQAPSGMIKAAPIAVSFAPAAPDVKVITKSAGTIVNDRQKLSATMTKTMQATPVFHHENGALKDVVFGVYTSESILGLAANSLVAIVKPDANGLMTVNDIPAGNYYFKELFTDSNYALNSNNFNFSLAYSGTEANKVTATGHAAENSYKTTTLELVKSDEETKAALEGAEFELYGVKSDGSVVIISSGGVPKRYVADANGKVDFGQLENGIYRIVEVKAPNGYVTENKNPLDVIVNAELGTVVRVELLNRSTYIEIAKYDTQTGKVIPGTHLQLLDKDGNILDDWITTNVAKVFRKLVVGETYTIHEVKAAPGYVKMADYSFTIENALEGQSVKVGNSKTRVVISKQVLTSGEELPGASMRLTDKDGNTVDEWVSGSTPREFIGLTVGESYTLHEDLAPLGYVTASSITFTVKETTDVQKVVMKDDITKVEISKQDASNGKELPGASMKLTDADGREVERWTSSDKPHVITGLTAGESYTLHEDLAPLGYAVASSITFTVKDTGEVQKLVMKDELTKVVLTKTDVTNGKPVLGAEIIVYDKDGKEVFKGKTDKNGKTEIVGLEAGKTYSFAEKLQPNGYTLNKNTFTFTIGLDGKVSGQTAFSDEPTRLEIKKTDGKGNALADVGFQLFTDAGVKITWRLENGIYIADASGSIDTLLSSQHGDIFMQYLPTGKYVLKETKTPNGYLPAKDIAIDLTDEHGVSSPLQITVKNEMKPVLPRTGETDALGYGIGAVSLALATILVVLKKRRKTQKEAK